VKQPHSRVRLAVVVGGALGTALRDGIAHLVDNVGDLPVATLGVNVLGAFLLGVIVGTGWSWTPVGRSLVITGLLGGLTTFSTFTIEVVRLEQASRSTSAATYLIASLALGMGAAAAGQALGRWRVATTRIHDEEHRHVADEVGL